MSKESMSSRKVFISFFYIPFFLVAIFVMNGHAEDFASLAPASSIIEQALNGYASAYGLDRTKLSAGTQGILEAPYIECDELNETEDLSARFLSRIQAGESFGWLFPVYLNGTPWGEVYIKCNQSICEPDGGSNGPSVGSAMYAEIIELWIEQKNATVLMFGCSKCMRLIHIPNVDGTNLTPISDGCAPMVEENYPSIRKSQLEIYLSQFGELTTEQRKQKILEFFSGDKPGLSKTQLQQSTLNKLNHVGDIRENIMKHHQIYNR